MNKRFTKISAAFGAAAAIASFALAGCSNQPPNTPPATSSTALFPCVKVLNPPPAKTGANDGPITPLKLECQNTRYQDDLDLSIPGTGIALGGDSVPGYPQIHLPGVYDGDNPLSVPKNTRPVPTGTAIGPHGEQYAFYAILPYIPNFGYVSADTVVVDLAHPGTPLFTLHGISQASGAYDAKTGRMVILGNTQDGHRALWQSAPVSQNAAWNNTLQPLGTFSGAMDGNRESQIVALPKGGFLVVGAGDDRHDHHTLPIQAVTASTPQGLLTAAPTVLVTPQTLPQVYGPTITDIRDINGKEVVTLRVGTYGIVGPPGIDHYDPHTYTTTFTITPPAASGSSAQAKPPTIAPRV